MAGVKFAMLARESREPGVLVPTPTKLVVAMERAFTVDVAYKSELVATYRFPPCDESVQCLRFAPADVSEIVVDARVPAICMSHAGVVVPMPRLNPKDDRREVEVAANESMYKGLVVVETRRVPSK